MKYRKKPVVIEAIQWTGDNWDDIYRFTGSCLAYEYPAFEQKLSISTIEGRMVASLHDWIIKGVNGEFYPCKPDIFEQTYEPVK